VGLQSFSNVKKYERILNENLHCMGRKGLDGLQIKKKDGIKKNVFGSCFFNQFKTCCKILAGQNFLINELIGFCMR